MTARLTAADIQARVVVTPDGCWEYPGKGDSRGYRFCGGDRAHRTSYRLHVGEIPAGLQIDHLCRNTGCVNPDHLEPVTNAENMRRRAAARTHCRHGHPWSPTNTRINCRGAKVCRECDRVIRRRYYQRRAERLSA